MFNSKAIMWGGVSGGKGRKKTRENFRTRDTTLSGSVVREVQKKKEETKKRDRFFGQGGAPRGY